MNFENKMNHLIQSIVETETSLFPGERSIVRYLVDQKNRSELQLKLHKESSDKLIACKDKQIRNLTDAINLIIDEATSVTSGANDWESIESAMFLIESIESGK
jgi:hypothetical protein